MIKRITDLMRVTSAPALAKGLLVLGGVVMAVVLGTSAWITTLYTRVGNLQESLDQLHRAAGQMEMVLQDLDRDREVLRRSVARQSDEIEQLRLAAVRAREAADHRAQLILEVPAPPAGPGVADMNTWWKDNVVQ